MLSRLKLGTAFRAARDYSGGFTGFFFSLSNIFGVPFKNFVPGEQIFIGVALASTLKFGLQVRENYQASFNHPNEDYKKTKTQSSMAFIAGELNKDPEKTRKFFHDYLHLEIRDTKETPADKEMTECKTEVPASGIVSVIEPAALENMMNEKMYAALQNKNPCYYAGKYLHCSTALLFQMAGHFMECMLAKSYYDPSLFDANSLTVDNILLIPITLLAFYNGYQSFQEVRASYEKPASDEALCESFLTTYQNFGKP